MLTFNVLPVTPYPLFNWAFTSILVWVPMICGVRAVCHILGRS